MILVFATLLLHGCLAVKQASRQELLKKWLSSEKACESFESSMFNPMRCKNPKLSEEVEKFASDFKAKVDLKATDLEPVIFVPGFAASGIDGFLDRKDTPAWFCWGVWREWFNMWLAFYELLTSTCLIDNMGLEFDATNGTFSDRPGVQTMPRDFGGLYGIDYVDITDDFLGWTIVFAEMTAKFKAVGYEEGVNLFGAPFDWRLPMYSLENGAFAPAFFALIETAYAKGGNKPVHIITHSYGGLVVLQFMNKYRPSGMSSAQFEAWLQKHVASYIPIAGPFSGTAKALRGVVSGDTFGAPSILINIDKVASVVRSFGGTVQLLPDPGFWPSNFSFITTPTRNYTAKIPDFNDLFAATGNQISAQIFARTANTINDLTIPTVQTYCLYGFDKQTEIAYEYGNGLSTSKFVQPTVIDMSDQGDGTVPLASLLECQAWSEVPAGKNHIRCREYDLDGHEDLQDDKMIADLIAIATGNKNVITTCETKNLDAAMEAHGDHMPAKAKEVRRLRAARLAQETVL